MSRALRSLLGAGLLMLLAACGEAPPVRLEAFVFGTRVELVSVGLAQDQARTALAEVLREFDRLHRAYHAWQASELTALNAALAAGQRAEVSDELAAMLADARALSLQSGGRFEPGLGALVALWGFHGDEFPARLPDPARRAALLAAQPRIGALHIDGRRVWSDNPALQIDLGGYAKGYALDRAAALLRARGVRNALINIGGNVLALGSRNGAPWQIGIARPRGDGVLGVVSLYDGEAIGTSGDYQRYFELGGQRYCHLLDPATGAPSAAAQAVTVLLPPGARAGTLSDVASKPVFLAGDDWRAAARAMGVRLVLRVAPDGTLMLTRAMRARLRWAGEEPAAVAVIE